MTAGEMTYGVLFERVRYFKEDEKGANNMCRAMEELCEKAKNEGKFEKSKEFVIKMLQSGKFSHEEIAEYSGLSSEDVVKIAAENNL